MRRPRIILADDHVSLVLAYEKLLCQDFEIVGTASDGSALLASAMQLQPDAIVVDLGPAIIRGYKRRPQAEEADTENTDTGNYQEGRCTSRIGRA